MKKSGHVFHTEHIISETLSNTLKSNEKKKTKQIALNMFVFCKLIF